MVLGFPQFRGLHDPLGFSSHPIAYILYESAQFTNSPQGKRKMEECDFSAIELLATLAGKILEGSESSSSSNAINADDIVKNANPDLEENAARKKIGSENIESDSFLERCSVVTSLCSMRKKRLRDEAIGKAYSFSNKRNKKVVYRDDDENLSKTNKPSYKPRNFRIRRMYPSRYWKVPKFKDYGNSKPEIWESGRRHSFECDGGFSGESVCNSLEEDSPTILLGVNGTSPNVRVNFRSIKLPNMFIDVPVTATVASLKRTVVDAMTNLIRNGMRIGVMHQGKKVREDDRTLSQSGITSKDGQESLSITIEPPSPTTGSTIPFAPTQKNPDLSLTTPNPKTADQSKALILLPLEPLAVAPPTQKTKRSDHGQRRARRPFSVAEVESLVQAVEELGTGRWRDVKVRSFENAEHRTYVDLKDKWKTLVHTARIAPQQRRGEPVPQGLLDRVLAAHAYWSQLQGRSPAKCGSVNLRITDVQSN